MFVNHTPSGHSVLANECKKETGQGAETRRENCKQTDLYREMDKKKKKDEKIKNATLRDGGSV